MAHISELTLSLGQEYALDFPDCFIGLACRFATRSYRRAFAESGNLPVNTVFGFMISSNLLVLPLWLTPHWFCRITL